MICENRRTKILAALAKRYEQEENLNKALEILREEATIEPDNETLALHIMEVYAESGNRQQPLTIIEVSRQVCGTI